MSFYQVSSGDGPAECELAVAKFIAFLSRDHTIDIIETMAGEREGTFKSVSFSTPSDLGRFCGSLLWTSPSPFRPCHKRKNWFFGMKRFPDRELADFDESGVVFQTMRASGHGGQHVNKTETAVRASYMGLTTVCSDERSQLANKKRAVERLKLRFLEMREKTMADNKKNLWKQHKTLERGKAVACFHGEKFLLR